MALKVSNKNRKKVVEVVSVVEVNEPIELYIDPCASSEFKRVPGTVGELYERFSVEAKQKVILGFIPKQLLGALIFVLSVAIICFIF